jgi:hypothetical protein
MSDKTKLTMTLGCAERGCTETRDVQVTMGPKGATVSGLGDWTLAIGSDMSDVPRGWCRAHKSQT